MEATCFICCTGGCAGRCETGAGGALGFCVETAAVRALSPLGSCCFCDKVVNDGSGFAVGDSAVRSSAVGSEGASEVGCAGCACGAADCSGALAAAICVLSAFSFCCCCGFCCASGCCGAATETSCTGIVNSGFAGAS